MFNKISGNSASHFQEANHKIHNKEKEINQRLSVIEESYVDAAIRKADGFARRNRVKGLTN